jgi:vancomycin resistance protein VanW
VDLSLQDNKAVNLSIAAPKVSGILIRPGETFSFWKLVGSLSNRKGYQEGLIITQGQTGKGIGGGMCQFTNLIHWMVLHTPMQITEHHHHDGMDLFPDFGRQVPFGTGTSIMHNYLDYRFKNTTNLTFQLNVCVSGEYLKGEIRANASLDFKYHIKVEDEYFSAENDAIYRNNKIYRECIDKRTGSLLSRELIKLSHAKVMYDSKYIPPERIVG